MTRYIDRILKNAKDKNVMKHLIEKMMVQTGCNDEEAYGMINYILVTYNEYKQGNFDINERKQNYV